MKKTIIYCGQLTDASGYGNAARSTLLTLDKYLDFSKYNLKVISISFEKSNFASDKENTIINKYLIEQQDLTEQDKETGVLIFHLTPDLILHVNENIKQIKNKINWSYWETDKLPHQFINAINNNFKKVFVSSKFNLDVYKKDIKVPVELIYTPNNNEELELQKPQDNDIFTIFSLSQWIYKKGFDILIKAYFQEFFNEKDVKLVIKTYRGEIFNNKEIEKNIIIEEARSYKDSVCHYTQIPKCKLEIITGVIPKQDIQNLYKNADVFCLPTRGEGYGLTILDALQKNINCIVPESGGHIDFCSENTFKIKCYKKPIEKTQDKLFSSVEMNFFEPDILDLRKQLRLCYNLFKEDKIKFYLLASKNKDFASNKTNNNEIFNSLMSKINE